MILINKHTAKKAFKKSIKYKSPMKREVGNKWLKRGLFLHLMVMSNGFLSILNIVSHTLGGLC